MSTLVNTSPIKVEAACNYCGHPDCGSHKRIRNGFICQECLNRAREEAAVAKKNLQSQGLTGNGIAAFLAAIGGVVCFLMGYPWIGVFLIVMAFSFGSSHETKKDPKADERRKNLGDVESAARSKLQSIYAQFIELPLTGATGDGQCANAITQNAGNAAKNSTRNLDSICITLRQNQSRKGHTDCPTWSCSATDVIGGTIPGCAKAD